jgi:hypothetical protein
MNWNYESPKSIRTAPRCSYIPPAANTSGASQSDTVFVASICNASSPYTTFHSSSNIEAECAPDIITTCNSTSSSFPDLYQEAQFDTYFFRLTSAKYLYW